MFIAYGWNVTNWSWNTIFQIENTSWNHLFLAKLLRSRFIWLKLPSAEADQVKSALNKEEFIPDAFRIVFIDPEIVELLPFWAII